MMSNIEMLIEDFKDVIDTYVSDFFVKEHWKLIKASWWDLLCKLEPPELASLLSLHTWKSREVWPLSLLALRTAIHSLSLDRMPINEESKQCEENSASKSIRVDIENGQYRDLEHCYRRNVKPKKQHEITELSKAISGLCADCRCDHVIDIGAGQGHLARILAFRYGLNVTTVEAAGCHTPKAQMLDRKVKEDIEKRRVLTKKERAKRECDTARENNAILPRQEPNHVTAFVDTTISVDTFLEQIELCAKSKEVTGPQTVEESVKMANDLCVSTELACPEPSETAGKSCYNGLHCCSKMHQSEQSKRDLSDFRDDMGSLRNLHGRGFEIRNEKTTEEKKQQSQSDGNYPENENLAHSCSSKQNRGRNAKADDGTLAGQSDNTSGSSAGASRCESAVSDVPPFVMAGLHACGDLTATMLRMFVKCEQCVGLAAVGCCYMKLSSRSSKDQEKEFGFPMSKHYESQPGLKLSYEALEMACHFIDCYHDRLLENGENLKTHCYRAALQEIIREKDPRFNHQFTRVSVKPSKYTDFNGFRISLATVQDYVYLIHWISAGHNVPGHSCFLAWGDWRYRIIKRCWIYAMHALEKMNLDPHLTSHQVERAEKRVAGWKDVVAYYTFRLALAPLVETLVLHDRVLFLREHGIQSELVPIFDPRLSPRNIVLLACKKVTSTNDP